MRKALLQRVVAEAAAGSDSPVARCAYTPAISTPDTCPADGQPRQGCIAIDTPLDFVGDERSADATPPTLQPRAGTSRASIGSVGITFRTRVSRIARPPPAQPTVGKPTAQPVSQSAPSSPQQQSTQMGPSMPSYDACTAAGRALVPRGVAGSCFALAKSHLKSFVEQNGALSTLKRCT